MRDLAFILFYHTAVTKNLKLVTTFANKQPSKYPLFTSKWLRHSSWWWGNVMNLHLFITCHLLSTAWLLIWHYLSYLPIYAYHWYQLSIFRWNPFGSPSPLMMSHSLLLLVIPLSFQHMQRPYWWTLTYLVPWLAIYCVYKTCIFTIEHQSWAGLSS